MFIASYVWMTGFGNFAYYYKTRDFSPGRFAQMMWRLNLLAILCCMVLNNEYMLYYICPMHTLYTVMVYAALALWRSGNDSAWGIWTKMAACVGLVVGVWEFKFVFYTIWRPFLFFLGFTDPRRPNPDAMHGETKSKSNCSVSAGRQGVESEPCASGWRVLSLFPLLTPPPPTPTPSIPPPCRVVLPHRPGPLHLDPRHDLRLPAPAL